MATYRIAIRATIRNRRPCTHPDGKSGSVRDRAKRSAGSPDGYFAIRVERMRHCAALRRTGRQSRMPPRTSEPRSPHGADGTLIGESDIPTRGERGARIASCRTPAYSRHYDSGSIWKSSSIKKNKWGAWR